MTCRRDRAPGCFDALVSAPYVDHLGRRCGPRARVCAHLGRSVRSRPSSDRPVPRTAPHQQAGMSRRSPGASGSAGPCSEELLAKPLPRAMIHKASRASLQREQRRPLTWDGAAYRNRTDDLFITRALRYVDDVAACAAELGGCVHCRPLACGSSQGRCHSLSHSHAPLLFDLARFPLRDRVCSEFYGAVTLASGHGVVP